MPHFATVLNQNKVFSPFDLNDNENLPLFACDPDANYYNDIAINSFKDSNFYSADSFNETYKKHYNKGHAEFSLCQINIRSIPAHLSELDAFLFNLCHSFSVIAITESWLNDTNSTLYNIDGYVHVYKHRHKQNGGGVSLLVGKHINFTVREDLCMFNEDIESLFIEIDKTVFFWTKKYDNWCNISPSW